MAIDTKAKRRSAVAFKRPYLKGVEPDATQPQGQRQASAWGYYGIEAAAAAVAVYPHIGQPIHEVEYRPVWGAEYRPVHEVERRKVTESWST